MILPLLNIFVLLIQSQPFNSSCYYSHWYLVASRQYDRASILIVFLGYISFSIDFYECTLDIDFFASKNMPRKKEQFARWGVLIVFACKFLYFTKTIFVKNDQYRNFQIKSGVERQFLTQSPTIVQKILLPLQKFCKYCRIVKGKTVSIWVMR